MRVSAAEFTIRTWDTADGLPQNSGTALVQTSDGYLWVGTFNGLVRFNGVDFTRFTVANTKELLTDDINSLHEDRMGRLWIGTYSGLVSSEGGHFTRWRAPEKLNRCVIRMFAERADGALFAASDRGFWRLENGRASEIETPDATWPSWSWIVCGPGGEVWAAQQKVLYRLDGDRLRRQFEVESVVSALAIGRDGVIWCGYGDKLAWRKPGGESFKVIFQVGEVRTLLEAKNGDWWVGTVRNGLRMWRNGALTSIKPAEGILSDRVLALAEDREGSIWVGTDGGGFSRVTPALLKTYDVSDGLSDNDVISVVEGRDGRVWLGTFNGGLCVGQNGRWQKFSPLAPVEVDESILALCETSDGVLWIGRNRGPLARLSNGQVQVEPRSNVGTVRALMEDRAGGLWVGSQNHGVEFLAQDQVRHWSVTNGLSDDFVTAIAQDSTGAIWVGTQRGLNRLADGQVKSFFVADGLGAEQVHSLFVDREGILWIGTAGGGLTRYREGRFASVTSRQGLPSDVVAQILEDGDNLWIGSTTGIFRVNKQSVHDVLDGRSRSLRSAAYGKKDGMRGSDCPGGFQPTCMKTRDGRLWFCTSAGVTVVDPGELKPAVAPPVHIQRIVADGVELSAADSRALTLASGWPATWKSRASETEPVKARRVAPLIIPPGSQRLEIHCAALSLAAPERVQYRFWLEPYEDDWQEPSARRVAYFNRVPPGKYSFHVAAANADGTESSSEAILAIEVQPTWRQTWWYRGAIVVCALGVLGAFYHTRVNGLKRIAAQQANFSRQLIDSQEGERKRIATELHDSLGQSLLIIKNHARRGVRLPSSLEGMQNSLNEIAETASEAVEEVRDIARALRPYQLDSLGLTRALQSLVNQAARAGNLKAHVEIEDIDRRLSSTSEINVFRIVQESLNNIVKHADASELSLIVRGGRNSVSIQISDNGKGFDLASVRSAGANPGGFGLRGIQERVHLLGGQWRIESRPGAGTRLWCDLQCAKEHS